MLEFLNCQKDTMLFNVTWIPCGLELWKKKNKKWSYTNCGTIDKKVYHIKHECIKI